MKILLFVEDEKVQNCSHHVVPVLVQKELVLRIGELSFEKLTVPLGDWLFLFSVDVLLELDFPVCLSTDMVIVPCGLGPMLDGRLLSGQRFVGLVAGDRSLLLGGEVGGILGRGISDDRFAHCPAEI